MLNMEALANLAAEAGFTHSAPLDVSTLELRDEVRAMCSANTCRAYGKNWSCPPACGELEDLRQRFARYSRGILVQTVGEVEDSMDFEGMMEAEAAHKEHFMTLYDRLLETWPGLLALGAGTCTRCRECTYPDAPCRFPDVDGGLRPGGDGHLQGQRAGILLRPPVHRLYQLLPFGVKRE